MNPYQSEQRNKLKMFTLEIKIILKQVFETLYLLWRPIHVAQVWLKRNYLKSKDSNDKGYFFRWLFGFFFFFLFQGLMKLLSGLNTLSFFFLENAPAEKK